MAFSHRDGQVLVFGSHHEFPAWKERHDAGVGEGPAQAGTNPHLVPFRLNGGTNCIEVNAVNPLRDDLVGGLGAA